MPPVSAADETKTSLFVNGVIFCFPATAIHQRSDSVSLEEEAFSLGSVNIPLAPCAATQSDWRRYRKRLNMVSQFSIKGGLENGRKKRSWIIHSAEQHQSPSEWKTSNEVKLWQEAFNPPGDFNHNGKQEKKKKKSMSTNCFPMKGVPVFHWPEEPPGFRHVLVKDSCSQTVNMKLKKGSRMILMRRLQVYLKMLMCSECAACAHTRQ